MEVCLKYNKEKLTKNKIEIIGNFVKFLNAEFPLKDDVTIIMKNESDEGMTTGSNKRGVIKVLYDGRMLIDVLRTLAHEWVHEHQYQYERKKANQDIGGPDEDEANAEAGRLLKMFAKENPTKEDKMYE